jgi:tetratricopeptide (TPR) repeat protein
MDPKFSWALLAVLILACSAACVARRTPLTIRSEPSGAQVRLNGRLVGTTPASLSFNEEAFQGPNKIKWSKCLASPIELSVSRLGYIPQNQIITKGPFSQLDKKGSVVYSSCYLLTAHNIQTTLLESPEADFDRGNKYRERGSFGPALQNYERAIEYKDNEPNFQVYQVYLAEARIYLDSKQYEAAMISLGKAIALQSDFAPSYYDRGLAYSALGRQSEAVADFSSALRLKPDFADAYQQLGLQYAVLKQPEKALNNFLLAARYGSAGFALNFNTGLAYFNLERYRDAIGAFDKSIRLDSSHYEAYYLKGVAASRIGDHQASADALVKAVTLKPDLMDGYLLEGLEYSNLGQHDQAIGALKQALRIKPDNPDGYLNLGWELDMTGRAQEALDADQQVIRLKPDYRMAYTNMARACDNLARYKEALEASEHALQLSPGDGETLYYKANAYAGLGQVQQARATYRQSAAALQKVADLPGYLWYVLGNDLYYLEDLKGAIAAYHKAVSLQPSFAQAHFNLGVACARVGMRDEAEGEYNVLQNLHVGRAKRLLDVMGR